jgi:hypothetical protein
MVMASLVVTHDFPTFHTECVTNMLSRSIPRSVVKDGVVGHAHFPFTFLINTYVRNENLQAGISSRFTLACSFKTLSPFFSLQAASGYFGNATFFVSTFDIISCR